MTATTYSAALTQRIGETIGGRWVLDEVVGSGAMAAVYRAHDASGLQVAVKILHPELASRSDVRPRFEREAELGTTLVHSTIARVLDYDMAHPKGAYLAMELLTGETLGERIDQGRAPEVSELLAIVEQVLGGLEVAHAQNVVHRDLKPDNIFLTSAGQVKLLDFGIARRIASQSDDLTKVGVALGTVAYMAPEQARGERSEIDARTDIYSLGAILFRLLAGRSVHQASTPAAHLAHVATRAAPALLSVAPGVAPGLAAVVDVALAFSKDARYPNAATMLGDVQAVRRGEEPPYASRTRRRREELPTLMGAELGAGLQLPGGGTQVDPQPPSAVGHTAPLAAPPDLQAAGARARVGEVLAGRYRVLGLLGTGGMGEVYRAEHVHMRKQLAIKVLHTELSGRADVAARFEREAVAAGRIAHPNVVAATDFGRLDDGSFYLALEFVEGESLRSIIGRKGAVPVASAVRIASQVASALEAAHAAQVVHRDLKPDNIMLVAGSVDVVKVLDFGIAKVSGGVADQALTRVGSVFGTPEYMSPEQAVGEPADARSDLYAVGVLLFEMLTGRKPFIARDSATVLQQQMSQPPPALPSEVDPRLAALTMQLLAKSPADRPQSARELVASLGAIASALPVGATSLGPGVAVTVAPTVIEPARHQPGAALPMARAVSATLPDRAGGAGTPRLLARWRQLPVALRIGGAAALLAVAIVASIIALGGDDIEARAAEGDPDAMAELMAVAASQRPASAWLALARGHARLGHLDDCRQTYAAATEARAKPAEAVGEVCAKSSSGTPP